MLWMRARREGTEGRGSGVRDQGSGVGSERQRSEVGGQRTIRRLRRLTQIEKLKGESSKLEGVGWD